MDSLLTRALPAESGGMFSAILNVSGCFQAVKERLSFKV